MIFIKISLTLYDYCYTPIHHHHDQWSWKSGWLHAQSNGCSVENVKITVYWNRWPKFSKGTTLMQCVSIETFFHDFFCIGHFWLVPFLIPYLGGVIGVIVYQVNHFKLFTCRQPWTWPSFLSLFQLCIVGMRLEAVVTKKVQFTNQNKWWPWEANKSSTAFL